MLERPSAWRREITLPGSPADRAAAAVIGLVVTLLYGRPLLSGEVYFQRDVQLMWLSHAKTFVQAVRAGEWPTWNPWIAFGQPLWADANAQVLYPPTWLLLLLEPWHYYSVFVLGHMLLAAAGLYVLCRTLAFSGIASVLAALLFVCSGPLASLVPIWNQLAGAAWMPWTLVFAIRALRRPGTRDVALWGCGHALQVLAGAPEAALMTGAGAAAVALFSALRSRPARAGRALPEVVSFLGAALIGLGLSAGQWVPSLEVARRSGRTELPAVQRTQWSVHPFALVQMVIPVALPDVPLDPSLRRGVFEATDLLPSLYMGAAAMGLVGLGLFGSRRAAATALIVCLLAAVFLAVGRHTPLEGLASTVFPLLRSFRYPVKAMVGAALAWALLCGLGLDAWRSPPPAGRRGIRVAFLSSIAVLAGALSVVLLVLGMAQGSAEALLPHGIGETARRAMFWPVAIALAAALSSLLISLPARTSSRMAAALAAVAVADLAATHATVNPTAPVALFTHRPPAADIIARDAPQRVYVQDYFAGADAVRYLGRPDPYAITRAPVGWSVPAARAFALRLCLFPPSGGYWGLRNSFDRDTPALAPRYLAALSETVGFSAGLKEQVRLLQIGAVTHVLALDARMGQYLSPAESVDCLLPAPGRILRVPGGMPRAHVVGRARGGDATLALLAPDFDPTVEVLLPDASAPAPDNGEPFEGTVGIIAEGTTWSTLRSRTSAPGYVVLADAYDPSWTARVDGRATPVLRANLAFRAVAVPAGTHEIEFRYAPRAVTLGLLASVLSAALVLALCFLARRRLP